MRFGSYVNTGAISVSMPVLQWLLPYIEALLWIFQLDAMLPLQNTLTQREIMNPSILAAIIGSIVAGVISVIVNILSLLGQHKLNQRNRRLINEDQWRRDTVSIVRELRREAMNMDLDGGDDELIQNLVGDIKSHLDRTPEKFTNSPTEDGLTKLRLANRDFESGNINRIELRQEIISKSEEVLDEFEEHPRGPDTLY